MNEIKWTVTARLTLAFVAVAIIIIKLSTYNQAGIYPVSTDYISPMPILSTLDKPEPIILDVNAIKFEGSNSNDIEESLESVCSESLSETASDAQPILPETSSKLDAEQTYIELTEDEIYTLATLVYLEGGGESFECQTAIASVVINRMTTRDMTLHDVLYEKNQFTPAHLIEYRTPSDSTLEAVRLVIENGPTIPEYVTFFREGHYFSWAIDYMNYDHTYFSYTQDVYDQVMSK